MKKISDFSFQELLYSIVVGVALYSLYYPIKELINGNIDILAFVRFIIVNVIAICLMISNILSNEKHHGKNYPNSMVLLDIISITCFFLYFKVFIDSFNDTSFQISFIEPKYFYMLYSISFIGIFLSFLIWNVLDILNNYKVNKLSNDYKIFLHIGLIIILICILLTINLNIYFSHILFILSIIIIIIILGKIYCGKLIEIIVKKVFGDYSVKKSANEIYYIILIKIKNKL